MTECHYTQAPTYNIQEAVVISCKGKWFKIQDLGTGSTRLRLRTIRNQVQYAPVAKSKNGIEAIGNYWLTQPLCQRTLGQEVNIFVDKKDDKKTSFYSFINFWLFPLFALLFTVLFFVFEKSKLFNRLLLLAFSVGSAYFLAKELDFLPSFIKTVSSVAPKGAIGKCISGALVKEDVTKPNEIKRLTCVNAGITNLSALSELTDLEYLLIQDNSLTSLETMPYLAKVKELHVSGIKTLTSLKGISQLPKLEYLAANKCAVNDISELVSLTQLKKLELLMNEVTDISSLSQLSQLQKVVLNYNNITSIEALANKPNLKHLQLHKNSIRTVAPLYSNTSMMVFGVSGKEQISCKEIDKIRGLLNPKAKVFGPKYCKVISN